MWRSEQRTFCIGSLRAKPIFNITLAYQIEFSFSPNDLIRDIEDSAFKPPHQLEGCTKN